MSGEPTYEVKGVERLVSTLHRAADEMASMDAANSKAAAMIASQARSRAPRRTGRLAGSISADRTGITASAPYAGPIHWGWPSRNIDPQPFAMNAARATEAQWIRFYEDDIQKALDGVKGE